MLKKVIITNYLGESMEYLIEGVQTENESGLLITSIDGLGPVKATINMTELTTTDGQFYNSSRLTGRNIVIKALFTHASSIEEARLLSYKYFPIKSKVKIRVETDKRIGETEGYVESNEPDIFSELSGCQISILCESPYFDGGEIEYPMGKVIEPLFKFAFGNESLDEKLIKMSEDIRSKDTNEVIYTGDPETGIELKLALPTSDIMDTLSATNITVRQEGVGELFIDTSKMASFVPDTSPHGVQSYYCSFIMDDSRDKFIQLLPEKVIDSYPVIYKGELQCFYMNDGDTHRMRLNQVTRQWERMEDPVNNLNGYNPAWLLCLNDVIYAYVAIMNTIYRLNNRTNYWEQIIRISGPISESKGHIGVVFNNVIHCFDVSLSGSTTRINTHHIFDGWNYYEASDTSNMQDVINAGGSNYLFGSIHGAEGQAAAFVYDGVLHIIGGNNGVGGGASDRHFTWNGENDGWTELIDGKLPSATAYIQCLTEYHNKIHIFMSYTKHYTWDSYNGWVKSFDTTKIDPSRDTNHVIADSDYLYSIGSDNYTSTYSEDPNNIRLIEHDELIVNSNTGQKSVYLHRGLEKYNILNVLDKNPAWFKLQKGVNRFSFTAETGEDDLVVVVATHKWYEGV